MKDRIFNNPITSLVGLILIGAGVYIITLDESETVTLTISALLIGSGLVALGLKDKATNA